MPCQLMLGFFAFAKSLDINVDKEELEGKSNFNFFWKIPKSFLTFITVELIFNNYHHVVLRRCSMAQQRRCEESASVCRIQEGTKNSGFKDRANL